MVLTDNVKITTEYKEPNLIEIQLDEYCFSLSIYEYGVSMYEEEIKDYFDKEKMNIIKFPDEVQFVSKSFSKGMFETLLSDFDISKNEMDEYIRIEASSSQLAQAIKDNVIYD